MGRNTVFLLQLWIKKIDRYMFPLIAWGSMEKLGSYYGIKQYGQIFKNMSVLKSKGKLNKKLITPHMK
jgi:hypothetical protein